MFEPGSPQPTPKRRPWETWWGRLLLLTRLWKPFWNIHGAIHVARVNRKWRRGKLLGADGTPLPYPSGRRGA